MLAVLLVVLGLWTTQIAKPNATILWFLGWCAGASASILYLLRDHLPMLGPVVGGQVGFRPIADEAPLATLLHR